MAEQHGVVFPLSGDPGASPDDDARRSTSLAGQQIVAAALRAVDPLGAAAAERESSWRQGYPVHFRRLVEAGLVTPLPGVDRAAGSQPAAPADPARPTADPAHANPAADHANPTADPAVAIARTGLAAVHDTMRWRPDPEGPDQPLTSAFGEPGALGSEGSTGSGAERLGTGVVVGEGARETSLTIPYQGERLGGDALRARLDTWAADGVIEPGVATAVEAVLAEPDWLDLRDTTVAVLGAGAEMGPLQSLLRWGADVVGVDLPRTELWRRVLMHGRRGAGRLIVPCSGPQASTDPQPVPERCGADLLHQVDAVERWLQELSGPFVLGNYVYADGATNVRVATAVDAWVSACGRPVGMSAWRSSRRRPTCSSSRRPRSSSRERPTPPGGSGTWCAVRCGPCRVAGCCVGSTPRVAPSARASATASCRSRARTTCWPSGSIGGARRRQPPTGRSSR
ncbi:hypothetical protein [Arsenicicoccus piscis]|uniref:Uncharacterized protein n=1 Tax=Arsenicicoccus piscis TaxID=673954 RepID=A0ABQ6HUX8_9MICO|nr:hypothetical protein [Arsenicicoccus piscis]GMA21360.1 hypothetical protein GCM10025862_33810 [Arsenicicoccus piscis]